MLRRLVNKINHLSRYAQRFGLWQGLRIYLVVNSFWRGRKVETVNFRFYGKPLAIRPKTTDVYVFETTFLNNDLDLSTLHLNPKLILDLGANVGYSSIFFARAYPQSRVFALEPEKSNFSILAKNVKPYGNIVPFQAAIWNKHTKLQIVDPNAEKWAFQVSETRGDEAFLVVNAITIDELLVVAKSNEIDILKVDVEGAEIELFSNNYESWLGRSNVIVIELHDRLRMGCSETFNQAVKNYDFHRTRRGEHTFLVRMHRQNF